MALAYCFSAFVQDIRTFSSSAFIQYNFRLFAKYPETQSDFPALAGLDSGSLKSSPNTVAQFENVRKGLESMVSNLGNASGLDAAAAKLAATHKDRSMPAANFQVGRQSYYIMSVTLMTLREKAVIFTNCH